ncbi:hypothetical protein LOK49_LG07G01064 [Camellia lanceoleosa]|uniref:Uncharacterized protein n=1 Tax=Camellia lanceoleosa TaxID=1840588 RepID=A0ACC0H064_9ERIC|nr:hypothetical protein LOK49_LG07G01064 [Camellia lanceoleosa]
MSLITYRISKQRWFWIVSNSEQKQAQRCKDVDLILRSALYSIRSALSFSPICYYGNIQSLQSNFACWSRILCDGTSSRLPIFHVVCNQTPPVGDKPSLMTIREVISIMSMWTKVQPTYATNMWNEALNKRLGTEVLFQFLNAKNCCAMTEYLFIFPNTPTLHRPVTQNSFNVRRVLFEKRPLDSLSIGENGLGSKVGAPLGKFLGIGIQALEIEDIGLGSSGFLELRKEIGEDLKLAYINMRFY